MADFDPEEKLQIRPGKCREYLEEFRMTEDGENFQFNRLAFGNKWIEKLEKAIEEVKDVLEGQLENNGIPEIKMLECMQKLVKLNLANNKVKGMNIFTVEDSFPNLKWLDVSNNKLVEIPALKLPKLEYLDMSHNKMEKINEGWTGHPNVRIVLCVDNKYKSLAPFK